jgi:phosphoribosylcarboxyaminoimidazole (NCAIR) mutase
MGLGSAGAKNAGLLAVQILATSDESLKEKLRQYRREQRESVLKEAAALETNKRHKLEVQGS